jgi:hypothetical protein
MVDTDDGLKLVRLNNGLMTGLVLSPFLFSVYTRPAVDKIVEAFKGEDVSLQMYIDDTSASLRLRDAPALTAKVVDEFGALGYRLNEDKTSILDGHTLLNGTSDEPLFVQVHGRDIEVIGHQGQQPSARGTKLLGGFVGCDESSSTK